MTLSSIYKKFPTQAACLQYIQKIRWKDCPICPYCSSKKVTSLSKENRHHCNPCNTSFSVTVGTVFHRTKIDLQKWLFAISLVLTSADGISARQLSESIKVNKNTAWLMISRIQRATLEQPELLNALLLECKK